MIGLLFNTEANTCQDDLSMFHFNIHIHYIHIFIYSYIHASTAVTIRKALGYIQSQNTMIKYKVSK